MHIGKFVKNIPFANEFPSWRIGISRNLMSSRSESGIASPRLGCIRIVTSSRLWIVISAVYTTFHTLRSSNLINGQRRIVIVFSYSVGEGWMARTARRGRRPQRFPKIVVRASQQLGFMSPINSCDFADRFSDLESRLPISLSLSFPVSLLLDPLPSFYPSTLALSFLTGAFRHSAGSFPTHENESLLAAVSLLLIIKWNIAVDLLSQRLGTFAGDREAYDSCACCSDKNRNLDVAGRTVVFYTLVNMKRQLISRVLHTSFAYTYVTSKFVKQKVWYSI